MDSGTNISALYREFTDALTEILMENVVGPARRGRSTTEKPCRRLGAEPTQRFTALVLAARARGDRDEQALAQPAPV